MTTKTMHPLQTVPIKSERKIAPGSSGCATDVSTRSLKSDNFNDRAKGRHNMSKEHFASSTNRHKRNMHQSFNPMAKKKNRMGQRARRALAESQYGSQANHLRNKARNAVQEAKPRHQHDNASQSLHPSWQARRQAQAKEQTARFSGVKKTFEMDSE